MQTASPDPETLQWVYDDIPYYRLNPRIITEFLQSKWSDYDEFFVEASGLRLAISAPRGPGWWILVGREQIPVLGATETERGGLLRLQPWDKEPRDADWLTYHRVSGSSCSQGASQHDRMAIDFAVRRERRTFLAQGGCGANATAEWPSSLYRIWNEFWTRNISIALSSRRSPSSSFVEWTDWLQPAMMGYVIPLTYPRGIIPNTSCGHIISCSNSIRSVCSRAKQTRSWTFGILTIMVKVRLLDNPHKAHTDVGDLCSFLEH